MGAGLVIALTIFVGDLMLPLGVAWAGTLCGGGVDRSMAA